MDPAIGQSGRERVLSLPSGAVSWDQEVGPKLGEGLHGRIDVGCKERAVEMEPTEQRVQLGDSSEPQRVPHNVHRPRVAAAGDDDEPFAAHVEDERLVVKNERVRLPE